MNSIKFYRRNIKFKNNLFRVDFTGHNVAFQKHFCMYKPKEFATPLPNSRVFPAEYKSNVAIGIILNLKKVVPISISYLYNASFPVSSMLKRQTKLN